MRGARAPSCVALLVALLARAEALWGQRLWVIVMCILHVLHLCDQHVIWTTLELRRPFCLNVPQSQLRGKSKKANGDEIEVEVSPFETYKMDAPSTTVKVSKVGAKSQPGCMLHSAPTCDPCSPSNEADTNTCPTDSRSHR